MYLLMVVSHSQYVKLQENSLKLFKTVLLTKHENFNYFMSDHMGDFPNSVTLVAKHFTCE